MSFVSIREVRRRDGRKTRVSEDRLSLTARSRGRHTTKAIETRLFETDLGIGVSLAAATFLCWNGDGLVAAAPLNEALARAMEAL